MNFTFIIAFECTTHEQFSHNSQFNCMTLKQRESGSRVAENKQFFIYHFAT